MLRSFEVWNFVSLFCFKSRNPFWFVSILILGFCGLAKVFGVGVRRIKGKTLRIRGRIWHNLPAMQETEFTDTRD